MNINKICHILSLSVLAICVIAVQASVFNQKSEIDSHLVEYSRHNVSHHDNIDDNIDDETHVHTHKHSEDGEEHEHNHEHSKVGQSEIKLLNQSIQILAEIIIIKSNQGIVEKNLISSPHPSELYRPPIFI